MLKWFREFVYKESGELDWTCLFLVFAFVIVVLGGIVELLGGREKVDVSKEVTAPQYSKAQQAMEMECDFWSEAAKAKAEQYQTYIRLGSTMEELESKLAYSVDDYLARMKNACVGR